MQTGKLLAAKSKNTYILKLLGDVRLTLCCTLDQLFEQVFSDREVESIVIDLSQADNLDSTTLGLLAKIAVKASVAGLNQPSIISSNSDITLLLESMGFRQYFLIMEQPVTTDKALEEVPQLAGSEEHIRTKVLEAHRTLMSMNDSNREAFKSVVQALEECPHPT
ncbi:Anti-anti-sigma regulatory factor (antagonist of anti-sigma factor) [Marinospirillum celere]|uniref:Anti-anti-sigma regulatory factor (Antagonist of anti-sigma factor) n=1 Tax=Marinospirillum celere TaxID=1122252 RepID=A0A1I1E3Z2_9GAMM|nr:STAS domain-containing protein [Marinospirillum celere]SFB81945.1 Anti-anti-sigma regulatory factor (antagonist of anti-sigma factor) [Marinospirillum celere]